VAHASTLPENNTSDAKRVQAAYTGKITKYAPLVEDVAARKNGRQCREIQPVVFSTLGAPQYDTAVYIERLGKGLRHGFAKELISCCAVTILQQQAAGYAEWSRFDRAVLRPSPHVRQQGPFLHSAKHDRATVTEVVTMTPQRQRQRRTEQTPQGSQVQQSQQSPNDGQQQQQKQRQRNVRFGECDCKQPLTRGGSCPSGALCPAIEATRALTTNAARAARALDKI
jgi:hypothetical protein